MSCPWSYPMPRRTRSRRAVAWRASSTGQIHVAHGVEAKIRLLLDGNAHTALNDAEHGDRLDARPNNLLGQHLRVWSCAGAVNRKLARLRQLRRRWFLTSAELSKAQQVCTETGERLVTAVRRLGIVAGNDLARAIAAYYALPTVGEQDWPKTTLLSDVLSPRYLREHKVLPLAVDGQRLVLAAADPGHTAAINAIQLAAGRVDRAARRACRGHRRRHRPLQAGRGGAGSSRAADRRGRERRRHRASQGPGAGRARGPICQSTVARRPQLPRHRHPYRAVPRQIEHPLAHRRHADGGAHRPGAHGARHRLARQDPVRPRHRRAAAAAGRPRPHQDRSAHARPAHRHHADHPWRSGRRAPAGERPARAGARQARLHRERREGPCASILPRRTA